VTRSRSSSSAATRSACTSGRADRSCAVPLRIRCEGGGSLRGAIATAAAKPSARCMTQILILLTQAATYTARRLRSLDLRHHAPSRDTPTVEVIVQEGRDARVHGRHAFLTAHHNMKSVPGTPHGGNSTRATSVTTTQSLSDVHRASDPITRART
jgi:hypothetical protein